MGFLPVSVCHIITKHEALVQRQHCHRQTPSTSEREWFRLKKAGGKSGDGMANPKAAWTDCMGRLHGNTYFIALAKSEKSWTGNSFYERFKKRDMFSPFNLNWAQI